MIAESCVKRGLEVCSFEWAIIDLEKQMRTTDQLAVTFSINEGVNVELNRELIESSLTTNRYGISNRSPSLVQSKESI